MSDFASIFIKRRKELGLSQGQVARRLNVTRQAVSKWETGNSIPDTTLMPQIAEMFDMSVDELLTGNKPEEQIVEKVVEKEVIREVEKEVIKEVTKPMPFRKILAFVAPIVLVIVLASALMGVYIPKAVAKNIPPTPEPEPPTPEIVYTASYIKVNYAKDDSIFQAPLILNKAHYKLNIRLSSDYTLYITAPKGAVATLNDEVIAEFDTAKTIEYSQYFEGYTFEKNEKYEENELENKEYVLGATQLEYYLIIDLTNCSDEDQTNEKQQINLKQKIGFDGVVVPANGTYFVAYPMCDIEKFTEIHHYLIKSSGIQYVEMWAPVQEGEYMYTGAICQYYANASASDFYIVEYPTNSRLYEDYYIKMDYDLRIAFKNTTDKPIALELEEMPIPDIELGQLVQFKTNGIVGHAQIFRLTLTHPIILEHKYTYDSETNAGRCMFRYIGNKIKYPDIEIPYLIIEDIEDGWMGFESLNYIKAGVYYVSIESLDGVDVTFVINDNKNPIKEFTK